LGLVLGFRGALFLGYLTDFSKNYIERLKGLIPGNPAISLSPVAFRPRFAAGWAFPLVYFILAYHGEIFK